MILTPKDCQLNHPLFGEVAKYDEGYYLTQLQILLTFSPGSPIAGAEGNFPLKVAHCDHAAAACLY